MAMATDTDKDFAAYKKSTGCTCDRGEGEMHSAECHLHADRQTSPVESSDTEHWRRIREQLEYEKHVEWLEQKIKNLEELLFETTCELNGYRAQKVPKR